MSSNAARKSFEIEPTGHSYRLTCLVDGCKKPDLGVWDFRANALGKGYAHSFLAHSIASHRGVFHAGSRMFQEPRA